jgi:type IV secretion system protein VirD4
MTMVSPEKDKINTLSDFLVIGVVVFFASVGATQFVADRFHHDPALGSPVIGSFYAPWNWLIWQASWANNGSQTFSVVNVLMLLLLGGLVFSCFTVITMRTRNPQRHEDVHGSAHFADATEVLETGLLVGDNESHAGVYVGGWKDSHKRLHYLRHNGPEHIVAIAPTRSGKGVGLVIPTLLTWPHSVVVNDMKAELWNLTAGYRKNELQGVVLKFDPASETGSCAFNPLDEVRLGVHEVGDVQNIANSIVDPEGKGLVDHWAKTSHAFLTGLILHLIYKTSHNVSLSDVADAISNPNQPVQQLYQELVNNNHSSSSAKKAAASAGQDMLNRPEQERGSVLSSAMAYLSIYRDPLVAKNISRSDFSVQDLMHYHQPVSLYLVVRPADKDRLKPLMRLILNQIVRVLTRNEQLFECGQPVQSFRHRLLLMLDEFPSFGRLDVFQESLAFIAGYGIKAYLVMQDMSQLQAIYGQHENIIANCHIRVAYAPNNYKTAEWLSKLLGQMTVVKEDYTASGKRSGGVLGQVSRAFHSVGRALLTPDEVMRLKVSKKDNQGNIVEPGEMLIFVTGSAPIKGKQILYFRDPWFKKAAQLTPPKSSDVISSVEKIQARETKEKQIQTNQTKKSLPSNPISQSVQKTATPVTSSLGQGGVLEILSETQIQTP